MGINRCTRAIAVLPSLEAIGQAIDQLVLSGFPLAQIFLIGKDTRPFAWVRKDVLDTVPIKELLHQATIDTVTGSSTTLKRGTLAGNFTGGVAGLLLCLGLLVVPGVGEAVLGSAIIYLFSTIGMGTLAGGAIGAWVGRGITAQQTKNYAAQVDQGNYLLIISGTETEIFRAEHILYVRGIQSQSWS